MEAAYLIDDITVEIIADGIHLPKPLLQFVYKFKGPDKTALCTDAMRGAGMPDGESIRGSLTNGQKVIIEDGVAKMPDRSAFAGSVATTDRLVRTMVQLAGIPLTDAIRMMTLTPARILHIDSSKGSLEQVKMLTLSFSTIKSMLLTQYQKAMLSIVNESETKVFQQELLTIKIYPTLQQMGNEAAKEVADRICKLLEEKAEINMIFAALPHKTNF